MGNEISEIQEFTNTTINAAKDITSQTLKSVKPLAEIAMKQHACENKYKMCVRFAEGQIKSEHTLDKNDKTYWIQKRYECDKDYDQCLNSTLIDSKKNE